ncbi:MAG TPA: SufD family Fe-S cluster assembly protein [Steroidobacteraceae bacterium]|nr:SufD family Fe-S cluster assembly protein [Steroidobacteraceae bacterium]
MTALPTNRDENWRYANLRPLARARADNARADNTRPELGPHDLNLPRSLDGFERWVFCDGRFVAANPSPDSRVQLLDARNAGESFAALLDADLAAAGVDFSLARINAARGDQVVQIEVADDSPALQLELVFVATAPAASGTSYPRAQIVAGRNSRLTVIERHLTAGTGAADADTDSVINAACDVSLRPGAVLEHIRVQCGGARTSHFDTLIANVGENATYRLRTTTLGGLTSRTTAFIKLAGRGARCEFGAAIVANGTQTHDMFVEIDHAAPETSTREIFRGIANDRGKLAFNGKMIVRENAHGADSDQSLRSLLTGAGAEAAARPQLEIYTDKVRAKHGATTGKLDEQMLFYLLSRGIDRPQAQALLQWAFIEDAVSLVPVPALRQEIEQLIAARLNSVNSLGLVDLP